MREINRIAEQTQRDKREFIQIGAAFEKNEFKAETLARIGRAVSGVIPPFGLRVFVRRQIARQITGSSSFRRAKYRLRRRKYPPRLKKIDCRFLEHFR